MSPSPLVRIVATAAVDEGRGHLSRGIALGAALAAASARVELLTLRGAPTAAEETRLSSAHVSIARSPIEGGLRETADVTVVDLPDPNAIVPGAGAGYPRADGVLVVFDDREIFAGAAAMIIQPSLPRWSGRAATGRVLEGYDYMPIAPVYAELARAEAGRGPADFGPGGGTGVPTVLVCFGGSDPAGVTKRIGPAIDADTRWRTEIVVGPGFDEPMVGSIVPVRDPPDLPARLAGCDLAVLGAGTMKFEAACIGCPMIVLGAADDQIRIGAAFAATGAVRWLGDGRTIDPTLVRDAVAALISDATSRQRLATRARAVVDGRGAERVAVEILGLIDERPVNGARG